MSFRHQLLKIPLIRSLASIRLTVLCLFLLFVLTFCGTVAQTYEGLYLAQQKYFHSFFFLIFGFIPFPGAQAIMWVLFFNLIAVALTRFVYRLNNLGIIVIHGGLLLFLVSGYLTLHGAKESHLSLKEGQAANYSTAYHSWEIVLWPDLSKDRAGQEDRDITTIDADNLKKDQRIKVEDLGIMLTVKQLHKNCDAYTGENKKGLLTASNIVRLEPLALSKEPEQNSPGVILRLDFGSEFKTDLLLYGRLDEPVSFDLNGKKYNIQLRLKHYPLPFTLRLKEFEREIHPGTDTPRSFKSLVEVEENGVWREKLISMNEPLRFNEYTLYQSSFIDGGASQRHTSTLAVVKNVGRLIPYIATFVTFLGLVIHFIWSAIKTKRRSHA